MRLRKKIISTIMAACISVTMLPVDMPLSAVEVKAEEVVALTEEDNTTDIKDYCKYIPTGRASFSFYCYGLPSNVNTVYLIDNQGNIVANAPDIHNYEGNRIFCTLYRIRKLNADERFHLGYKTTTINDNNIYVLKNTEIIVTDKPYIDSISLEDYFYKDDGCVVSIWAYNIDFSKLSFTLNKDGKTVASSVSSTVMKDNNNKAYYYIEEQNGEKLEEGASYEVVYSYPDVSDIPKYGTDSFYYSSSNVINSSKSNIQWNYKTESLEYYDRNMLPNSKINYEIYDTTEKNLEHFITSGAAITVDDNHLVEINLQETIKKDKKKFYDKGIYYLCISDTDGKQKDFIQFDVGGGAHLVLAHLYDCFYLSSDTEFEFSVGTFSGNESSFPEECIANIDGNPNMQVAMTRKKNENGNLLYNGTYNNNKLEVGRHTLSFSINENKVSDTFYVYNSNQISVQHQNNSVIDSEGIIQLFFPSNRIANHYCGEENSKIQNNLKIRIFDMPKSRGTEIYSFDSSDFIIKGDYSYRNIQFNDITKEELDNLYFGYIYIYIIDENGNELELLDANDPSKSLYNNDYQARYIRYENDGYISFITSTDNYSTYSSNMKYVVDIGDGIRIQALPEFAIVSGSNTAFPATVTITDWYSLKPIKTINVPSARYTFTESDVAGLASKKLYRFFLQGNDGSANNYIGYVKKADNDDNQDDNNQNDNDNSTNNSNNTSSGISGGGVSVSYVTPAPAITPAPTVTQAPTATPQPTATLAPTIAPAPVVTPVPTATQVPTPEPTAAPEETTAPQPTNEPENISNITTAPSEAPGELKIKKKNITLKEGQKARIKIASELNTDVVYKSLNPSVATVNKNGIITAKKNGRATITVKANGKVRKVKVNVKVAKKSEMDSSSGLRLSKNFKLSKSKVTLKRGNKLKITRASALSGKVTYRSLNKKIASVSSKGVIKAKRKGKATIQIKRGKKTIKLRVTVKK